MKNYSISNFVKPGDKVIALVYKDNNDNCISGSDVIFWKWKSFVEDWRTDFRELEFEVLFTEKRYLNHEFIHFIIPDDQKFSTTKIIDLNYIQKHNLCSSYLGKQIQKNHYRSLKYPKNIFIECWFCKKQFEFDHFPYSFHINYNFDLEFRGKFHCYECEKLQIL